MGWISPFQKKIVIHSITIIIIMGAIAGIIISANPTLASTPSPPDELENAFTQRSPSVSKLPEGWQVYSNEGFGFEISYPANFTLKTDFDSIGLNTGLGVAAGAPVWKFALNDALTYQETNLVEASLIINVQNTPEALAQCSQFKAGSIYTSPKYDFKVLPTADVNSIIFYKDIVEEGAMGDIYKKISYRTPHNEACYEITLFIHSLNIDFLPPGSISTFDESEITAKLDSIFSTFNFLDLTPTFPKITNPSAPQQMITAQPLGGPNPEEDGIDVSHWQGEINWSQVYGAGYTFAFTKATEGDGYTDNKFVYNTTQGRSAGVLMGAYHFARPDLFNGSVAEAQYFVDQAGDYLVDGHLRPVLDLEVRDGLGKEELSAWVVAWMETVRAETGIEPLIYTNPTYVNNYLDDTVYQYELWIAHWTCDPTPSTSTPNVGPWHDWDFWQYYGPSYCGANSIPGISGSIDLNIFNGYLPGLQTFEINRPLFVSLTANPPSAHAPSNTQLITNVSGYATGDINYNFWWDCDIRGLDITATAAACGDLPEPSPGECAENQSGMKCAQIDDPAYMVNHLYEIPGDFTAKVITERDGNLAEDRYLITVVSPILSISPNPASPAYGLINETFQLNIDVDVSTSLGGALQISLVDSISEIKDSDCKLIPDDTTILETFNLSFTETEIGQKDYLLWTRFRAGEDCPIEDSHPLDEYELYTIIWGLPEIDLQRPAGISIPSGGADDLGDRLVGAGTLTYTVDNSAGTTQLSVSNITPSNFVNVSNFSLNTSLPLNVGPGETGTFEVSFDVDSTGTFGFDLDIANNDGDENPYQIQINGTGVTPEIDLQRPAGTSIPSGGSDDAGNRLVGAATLTYTVNNSTGTSQLSVSDITSSNLSNISNFSLDTSLPLNVAPGMTGTFEISFDVDATGAFGFDLDITNNDKDENPYQIQVSGVGVTPEIDLQRPAGTSIPSGGADNLGDHLVGAVELTYIVDNSAGTGQLTVSAVTASNLSNISNFSLDTSLPLNVAPGADGTFEVTFEVDAAGTFSFDLEAANNDGDENPYNIHINGTGLIQVFLPLILIER